MAMSLDVGFNLYLNDHGEDKKSYDNVVTSTKNLLLGLICRLGVAGVKQGTKSTLYLC